MNFDQLQRELQAKQLRQEQQRQRPQQLNVPRLTPWAGFSFDPPSAASRACEHIARLLMSCNGRWHKWEWVVEKVVESEGLTPGEAGGLLEGMLHTGCVEERRIPIAGEAPRRNVRMARYLYQLAKKGH